MKARKKPVVVDFEVWYGDNDSIEVMERFIGDSTGWSVNRRGNLLIETLEGEYIARKGDYIIKGVKGEFYPCKPDIFAKTYDILEE